MEAAGVDDPLQILPELVNEICMEATSHARSTAQAVARAEIQHLLRKAIHD
jgi:hypothetical protein